MYKTILPFITMLILLYSCDLINFNNKDDKNQDSEAVPAGQIVLNFLYAEVEWMFTYNDSSVIIGNGGHNGNFDSNYGDSEMKTENGVKVITASIDRVMPFGETVEALLKLTFNSDESMIEKLEFEKSEMKNDDKKWSLQAKEILFLDEDDTKKIYKITSEDVCTYTTKSYYKLKTDSYYKTISNWKRCQPGDISHITIEIYK